MGEIELTRQARRTREYSPFRQAGGIVGAALVLTSVLALAGCGSGDDGTTSTADLTKSPERPSAERTQLAAIQGAAARAKGRKACEGMTPLEVARHYQAAAREAGVTKRFAQLATEPSAKVQSSSGYPRLAAAIYATTTPEKSRAAAAAGCAEVLAADGEGGEVSSERTGQTVPPSQGGADQKGSN
jgi:hypothetical protein